GRDREVVADEAHLRVLGAVDLERLVVVDDGDVGARGSRERPEDGGPDGNECRNECRSERGDLGGLHQGSCQIARGAGTPRDASRTTVAVTTGASASASARASRPRPSGAIRSHSAACTAKPSASSRAARAPRSAQRTGCAAHRSRAAPASGAGTASATSSAIAVHSAGGNARPITGLPHGG